MKPTLFIDFDGTLCHDKFWSSLDPILLEKVQQILFSDDKTVVSDWMKGIYTSEDINKKLADKLGVEYNLLWDGFVKDCQNMKVGDVVLELLQKLRSTHTIVLITDNMDCFDRFTVPSLKLDEYFDTIINSFNERATKNENDGQLFREVINRLGLSPDNCVLMDNSELTCRVFEKLGGTSYLVTKEQPLSYWLEIVKEFKIIIGERL